MGGGRPAKWSAATHSASAHILTSPALPPCLSPPPPPSRYEAERQRREALLSRERSSLKAVEVDARRRLADVEANLHLYSSQVQDDEGTPEGGGAGQGGG